MNSSIANLCDVISRIAEENKDNEYLLQRLEFHVNNMESVVKSEYKNHSNRVNRANRLASEQTIFVDVFLNKNHYYYLQNNGIGCFYEYDGKHYRVIKEDDIHHKILTTITPDDSLQDWKYKTKTTIMKQIKTKSLFESTPNSETIQWVLKKLSPSVFTKRENAKYFLTILGDNILKKNKELIYLSHGKAKQFLTEIDNHAYIAIGQTNILRNVIKYHESHSYSKCRLLNINDDTEDVFSLDQSLNLFGVACHYSNRFGGADEYVDKKSSEEFKRSVFYLKDNTKEDIVDEFCNKMLDMVEVNCGTQPQSTYILKWKDIHYLWKMYLSNEHLPHMLYSGTLKQILSQKYTYSELNDCFTNVTSKHLPRVCSFIDFWEKYLCEDQDELEIDEICHLAKSQNVSVDDAEVLKIIHHFFPSIEILHNKYVTNISCTLWDKKKDIESMLVKMNKHYHDLNAHNFISFEDAYAFYCKTYTGKLIVSKTYFENYLRKSLSDHIVYDDFITNDWYETII